MEATNELKLAPLDLCLSPSALLRGFRDFRGQSAQFGADLCLKLKYRACLGGRSLEEDGFVPVICQVCLLKLFGPAELSALWKFVVCWSVSHVEAQQS